MKDAAGHRESRFGEFGGALCTAYLCHIYAPWRKRGIEPDGDRAGESPPDIPQRLQPLPEVRIELFFGQILELSRITQ